MAGLFSLKTQLGAKLATDLSQRGGSYGGNGSEMVVPAISSEGAAAGSASVPVRRMSPALAGELVKSARPAGLRASPVQTFPAGYRSFGLSLLPGGRPLCLTFVIQAGGRPRRRPRPDARRSQALQCHNRLINGLTLCAQLANHLLRCPSLEFRAFEFARRWPG